MFVSANSTEVVRHDVLPLVAGQARRRPREAGAADGIQGGLIEFPVTAGAGDPGIGDTAVRRQRKVDHDGAREPAGGAGA